MENSSQECHALEENSGRAEFKVVASGGVKVPARLEMKWILKDMKWAYHLQVGGESVPAYWNKVKGFVPGIAIPDIGSATIGPLPGREFQTAALMLNEVQEGDGPTYLLERFIR